MHTGTYIECGGFYLAWGICGSFVKKLCQLDDYHGITIAINAENNNNNHNKEVLSQAILNAYQRIWICFPLSATAKKKQQQIFRQ